MSFIIVIFSIVEKVNWIKKQDLTLLYVNICWRLFCWHFIWWMLIIWAAVEYINDGLLATRITLCHLVIISLYYCWSVFLCLAVCTYIDHKKNVMFDFYKTIVLRFKLLFYIKGTLMQTWKLSDVFFCMLLLAKWLRVLLWAKCFWVRISLLTLQCICAHIKVIPWKFRFFNPTNSVVIWP